MNIKYDGSTIKKSRKEYMGNTILWLFNIAMEAPIYR